MPRPLLALFALLLVSCSGAQLMDSPRRDRPIQVDGKLADWEGRIHRVEKAGLSLGSAHDDEALHLVLVAANPGLQQQILGHGLTLWIDGDGGKDEEYGILYPRRDDASRAGLRPNRAMGALDAEDQRRRLEERVAMLGDEFLLITDKDGGGRLMIAGGKHGFDLAMGLDGPRLVYELRIPLASSESGKSSRYALSVEGEQIALGLKVDRPEGERGPGKASSMMGGPGGGQGGGRRGAGQGGEMGSNLQPRYATQFLDAWVKLKLN